MPCSALNTPEQFVADQRGDERRPLGTLTPPDARHLRRPRARPSTSTEAFYDADLVAATPARTPTAVLVDELGHGGRRAGRLAGGRPCLTALPTLTALRPPAAELRVLTFGAFVAGNTAALILAELGMDVVKIESRRPSGGAAQHRTSSTTPTCASRRACRRRRSTAASPAASAASPSSSATRRGPRSFRRLAATADVVVENFRPGVLDRFGCGFADLQAVNPRLSMLSISGYGAHRATVVATPPTRRTSATTSG